MHLHRILQGEWNYKLLSVRYGWKNLCKYRNNLDSVPFSLNYTCKGNDRLPHWPMLLQRGKVAELKLMRSYVTPIIEYCSTVWSERQLTGRGKIRKNNEDGYENSIETPAIPLRSKVYAASPHSERRHQLQLHRTHRWCSDHHGIWLFLGNNCIFIRTNCPPESSEDAYRMWRLDRVPHRSCQFDSFQWSRKSHVWRSRWACMWPDWSYSHSNPYVFDWTNHQVCLQLLLFVIIIYREFRDRVIDAIGMETFVQIQNELRLGALSRSPEALTKSPW